jgi:hypothetical protein
MAQALSIAQTFTWITLLGAEFLLIGALVYVSSQRRGLRAMLRAIWLSGQALLGGLTLCLPVAVCGGCAGGMLSVATHTGSAFLFAGAAIGMWLGRAIGYWAWLPAPFPLCVTLSSGFTATTILVLMILEGARAAFV